MKNNPNPDHAPAHLALMQAHGNVNRAISEIRLAGQILRRHLDQREEPNNIQEHIDLVRRMQGMLYDIQHLIGCNTMRYYANFMRYE